MKIVKFLGSILIILGLVCGGLTVWVGITKMGADPVLLTQPEASHTRVVTMMDAFCAGDYQTAQKMLQGETKLGVDRAPSDAVGAVIWEAFQKSMTYELIGQQYATDDGLAQDICITTLDMNALTDYVEENAKLLLEERVQKSLDTQVGLDEIYDENDEYRDEFVQKILLETAQKAVEQATATVRTELTLTLAWDDGLWWIVPNDQLLNAVSGGIVG